MRAALCALSLVFAPLAVAAPAPLPRLTRPVSTVEQLAPRGLAGDWVMTWGKGEWKVSLSAFGTYAATQGRGSIWVGTWSVDGPGSFHVTEALIDETGQRRSEMTWAVSWERGKDGRFDLRCLNGVVRRYDGSALASITLRRPRGK